MKQPLPIQRWPAFQLMMTRKLMRTKNSVRLLAGQLRDTAHETRDTPGPPSQDLTSGSKQPESDNHMFYLIMLIHKKLSYGWVYDILDNNGYRYQNLILFNKTILSCWVVHYIILDLYHLMETLQREFVLCILLITIEYGKGMNFIFTTVMQVIFIEHLWIPFLGNSPIRLSVFCMQFKKVTLGHSHYILCSTSPQSSDMLKLCPTRKKNWLFVFFLIYFLRHCSEQSSHCLFFMSHA